ncbi:MAG: lytic transglycosylase domain-containing protein [Cryobacterium sp.]|nr:lytic transglycosylase domain-containing protein [Oligoflexia bacterium]
MIPSSIRLRIFLILSFTALSLSGAWAAYEPSSTLSLTKPFDPDRAFRAHYGTKDAAREAIMSTPGLPSNIHQMALNDFDNRIDETFRVPAPLRDTVSLWLRVYTEFTTEQTVLFDKKHPEVIYEVLDFRDLKRRSRNAMAYELTRERKLKKQMAEYRVAFSTLIKKSKKGKVSADDSRLSVLEKKILLALSRSEHQHPLREWNTGFRAQTGQRDQVVKGLLSAETFFPKMEEIFEELGIPKELTRIPLVESSFNINAHSKAGAQGVWQFMPASGKEFMKVDAALGIDERLSPLKSTVAAARLLRRNLIIAGNWPLAITAYNHGYTGIKPLSPAERATALDGRLFTLCSNKRRTLGYASSNYYAEFLALLHAEAYKDLFYGDTPLPVAPALTFHRVKVPLSGRDFASRNGIPLQDFRLFNPDVKNMNARLPLGFHVILPGNDGEIDDLISSIKARVVRTRRFAGKDRKRQTRSSPAVAISQ